MIPLKKHAMKRRTFLRGALRGSPILLGLPLLDAMLDGRNEAQAQTLMPKRFVSWFFGNGVNLDKFEPDSPGSAGWTLPPVLSDLGDLKDYLTICTGLQNRFSGTIKTHHEGLTAFTGYDFVPRPDLIGIASDFGGPTIDQVIADRIAADADPPLVHSLQIQISKFLSPADTGTTSGVISAQGEPGSLTPKQGISNPRELFQLLFGVPPAPLGVRSSMLDFLKYDIGQIRKRLGTTDQVRMDAHLDGIRGLELQAECTAPAEPIEENLEPNGEEALTLVNNIMAELIAVCFDCDLTRVASVMFVGLAGESTFGVDMPQTSGRTHHMWSHNQTSLGSTGAVDGLTGYEQNIRFIMNRYGDWMRALKGHLEPDGVTNLLDTTILYASSDCANGNHMINRQPILIGGHGRGHLKSPGIHFQAVAGDGGPTLNSGSQPAAGNMSDVLLTCLRAFDPAAASVGDVSGASTPGSTTPQTEIEA
jgi:hypothetical protein